MQEIFPHIRIVMGMIIGLGMARLLSGIAQVLQHSGHKHFYGLRVIWAVWLLIELIFFWWWQFRLFEILQWRFSLYAFVIFYAIVLYLLCSTLFPEHVSSQLDNRNAFFRQRVWFFGLMAISYLVDVVDTWLKVGNNELYPPFMIREYLFRTPIFVILCLIAMRTKRLSYHVFFIAISLIYQVSWIMRYYTAIS